MALVSCENEFCIYQESGDCILDSIQLDIQGNCMECIYVNVSEDFLCDLKKKALKNL